MDPELMSSMFLIRSFAAFTISKVAYLCSTIIELGKYQNSLRYLYRNLNRTKNMRVDGIAKTHKRPCC